MSSLLDSQLAKKFIEDQRLLADTKVPILIYSSVVRGGKQVGQNSTQLALALAIVEEIWGGAINPEKAWITDLSSPITYKQWLAFYSNNELAKVDSGLSWLNQLRGWFSDSETTVPNTQETINALLLHLTKSITQPIVSLSNDITSLLLDQGKQVLHISTESLLTKQHVRFSDHPQLKQIVFDQRVKEDVLEAATLAHRHVIPDSIVVTEAPVSYRIATQTKRKLPWRSGPLRLLVTITGSKQNQIDSLIVVKQLVRGIADSKLPIQLLVYCGTNTKTAQKITTLVQQARLSVAPLTENQACCRVLHHQQPLAAHQQLIQFGWGWAHGCIAAPTIDLATDALASGCFLLTLPTHSDWESDLLQQFITTGTTQKTELTDVLHQLHSLMRASDRSQSWIERAMHATHSARARQSNGTSQMIKLLENWK